MPDEKEREQRELTPEELENEDAKELPDREEMSIITPTGGISPSYVLPGEPPPAYPGTGYEMPR